MSRIGSGFRQLKTEGKRGFIPFITAGDPDLETTTRLLVELGRTATVIELGIPFSDPMADGPVIQRASERALRHGFGIADVLKIVALARREIDTPIILFSYFNPLFQYGLEHLVVEARASGVDGVLATDLAPEESREFAALLKANELDMILLVAPTSTDARLKMVAECATGFIYAVSRAGVTGQRETVSAEARKLTKRVREFSSLPVAVGFGISNSSQVAETWEYADAAVVGSAIVAEIEKLSGRVDLVARLGEFVNQLLPNQPAENELL